MSANPGQPASTVEKKSTNFDESQSLNPSQAKPNL